MFILLLVLLQQIKLYIPEHILKGLFNVSLGTLTENDLQLAPNARARLATVKHMIIIIIIIIIIIKCIISTQ